MVTGEFVLRLRPTHIKGGVAHLLFFGGCLHLRQSLVSLVGCFVQRMGTNGIPQLLHCFIFVDILLDCPHQGEKMHDKDFSDFMSATLPQEFGG